jgi:hypothetical protein
MAAWSLEGQQAQEFDADGRPRNGKGPHMAGPLLAFCGLSVQRLNGQAG